ncbi:Cupin 2, conserved barrel domain protein [Labilithrix luteola]|uniref:Cupin 2, conserved barrel domain protein n=1 Tax=Labilithrix luteola TaxID=1391654 RepID=A0A0K1PMB1_9BACT|nr:cupin domain-containing protein [Labilithrix luteola]AKU94541.1 Cupin 2, conserved barrel domain protein [Labilithrix luteola]
MKRPIINLADVELNAWGHGASVPMMGEASEKFQAQLGPISGPLGAKLLGYGLVVVRPGKAAFPFHNHVANEEMFFVLEGAGEIRIGDQRYPIKKGDVIACPPGGTETARQIVNTGESDLHYLGVSTRLSPEILQYPDTKRVAFAAILAPDASGQPRMVRQIVRDGETMQYWDEE